MRETAQPETVVKTEKILGPETAEPVFGSYEKAVAELEKREKHSDFALFGILEDEPENFHDNGRFFKIEALANTYNNGGKTRLYEYELEARYEIDNELNELYKSLQRRKSFPNFYPQSAIYENRYEEFLARLEPEPLKEHVRNAFTREMLWKTLFGNASPQIRAVALEKIKKDLNDGETDIFKILETASETKINKEVIKQIQKIIGPEQIKEAVLFNTEAFWEKFLNNYCDPELFCLFFGGREALKEIALSNPPAFAEIMLHPEKLSEIRLEKIGIDALKALANSGWLKKYGIERAVSKHNDIRSIIRDIETKNNVKKLKETEPVSCEQICVYIKEAFSLSPDIPAEVKGFEEFRGSWQKLEKREKELRKESETGQKPFLGLGAEIEIFNNEKTEIKTPVIDIENGGLLLSFLKDFSLFLQKTLEEKYKEEPEIIKIRIGGRNAFSNLHLNFGISEKQAEWTKKNETTLNRLYRVYTLSYMPAGRLIFLKKYWPARISYPEYNLISLHPEMRARYQIRDFSIGGTKEEIKRSLTGAAEVVDMTEKIFSAPEKIGKLEKIINKDTEVLNDALELKWILDEIHKLNLQHERLSDDTERDLPRNIEMWENELAEIKKQLEPLESWDKETTAEARIAGRNKYLDALKAVEPEINAGNEKIKRIKKVIVEKEKERKEIESKITAFRKYFLAVQERTQENAIWKIKRILG